MKRELMAATGIQQISGRRYLRERVLSECLRKRNKGDAVKNHSQKELNDHEDVGVARSQEERRWSQMEIGPQKGTEEEGT
ncbi:hypothetical protein L596_006944 [Steinernema carpocapsae]|uniref:Uncharacterized protein n=1 Tax=Steinernema carpocapsae TaxID=34508 RepID=A0A4U5P8G1_STECR|nr:hypothetical protein L596_006944 [Steinernema carpocapsae]